MPSEVVVEVKCRVEEGVVFMGVAFRANCLAGLPVATTSVALDRGLQGSTHCEYCVHGTHLLPMDHDRQNASTPGGGVACPDCPCHLGQVDGGLSSATARVSGVHDRHATMAWAEKCAMTTLRANCNPYGPLQKGP